MRLAPFLAALALVCVGARAWAGEPRVEAHHLELTVEPAEGIVRGTDRLTVVRAGGGPLRFDLGGDLAITEATLDGRTVEAIRGGSEDDPAAWTVDVPPGPGKQATLVLRYAGRPTARALPGNPREPALDTSGGSLGRAYGFYPDDRSMARFDVALRVPAPFTGVALGSLTARTRAADGQEVSLWKAEQPTDGLLVEIGRWRTIERSVGRIRVRAHVARLDDAAASALLDEVERALERRVGLLGPYPLDHLDLVEGGGADGPGLVSLTRFLVAAIEAGTVTSAPHRMWLHSRIIASSATWGSEKAGSGPWPPGLGAYCARRTAATDGDQESAREARAVATLRRTLEADAVEARPDAEPPVRDPEQIYHMLRREIGDGAFRETLRTVARESAGTRLGETDWKRAFELSAGRNLGAFFDQWLGRSGTPVLQIADAEVKGDGGRLRATGVVRQVLAPGEAPWRITVPVVVTHLEGEEHLAVTVTGPETGFSVLVPSLPLSVELDPDHHLLRRMAPRDIPPCLAATLARPAVLIVFPDGDAGLERHAQELAGASDATAVRASQAPAALPTRKSLVLLGDAERIPLLATLRANLDVRLPAGADAALTTHRSPVDGRELLSILVVRPDAPARAATAALGFRYDERVLIAADGRVRRDRDATTPRGTSLLPSLAPVASAAETSAFERLEQPDLEGRVAGTAGDRKARGYVATELTLAGLDVRQQPFSFAVKRLPGERRFLQAEGATVAGAFPLIASPETPERGVLARGCVGDLGGDLQGRALLLDLPAGSDDPLAFARGAASLARAQGAVALVLRLPEVTHEGISGLTGFPEELDGDDTLRRSAVIAARTGALDELALPAVVVPTGWSAPSGALVVRVRFERHQVETANVVGRLRAGTDRKARPVLIGAALDGSAEGHRAVAAAAVLEAGSILGTNADKLGRDVEIVLFGAEAWGGRGTRAYLASTRPERLPSTCLLAGSAPGVAGVEAADGPLATRLARAFAAAVAAAGADPVWRPGEGSGPRSAALPQYGGADLPAAVLWIRADATDGPVLPRESVSRSARALALATLAFAGGF